MLGGGAPCGWRLRPQSIRRHWGQSSEACSFICLRCRVGGLPHPLLHPSAYFFSPGVCAPLPPQAVVQHCATQPASS
jgi:hypothetical protein